MERLCRPGADENARRSVGHGVQYRSAARLRCRPVLQRPDLTDNFEVGGQATYRSKIYGGTLLAADSGTVLPSYWRFDSFIDGKVMKNWKWKLFANNIFNKLYYDAFYQSTAPFTLVAPGRVLGVELSAKF
jgi:catecholate siderophore receptor